MQQVGDLIQAYMDKYGLSQAQLAKAAGVSQPTVSRALRNLPLRRGKAKSRLFSYVGINELNVHLPPTAGTQRVLEAFERIWDHTDEHAEAVAKVIEALADLRPTAKPKGEGMR